MVRSGRVSGRLSGRKMSAAGPGAPSPSPIVIDVTSDFACPWCYVGYKRLENGILESNIPVKLNWHPFMIDMQTKEGGVSSFIFPSSMMTCRCRQERGRCNLSDFEEEDEK